MAEDLKLGLVLGYWFAGPPVGVPEMLATAEDLGVVTTVIDVPHPPDPPITPQLTKQIHDVTSQVVRIVG